jgi:hypothetical protein
MADPAAQKLVDAITAKLTAFGFKKIKIGTPEYSMLIQHMDTMGYIDMEEGLGLTDKDHMWARVESDVSGAIHDAFITLNGSNGIFPSTPVAFVKGSSTPEVGGDMEDASFNGQSTGYPIELLLTLPDEFFASKLSASHDVAPDVIEKASSLPAPVRPAQRGVAQALNTLRGAWNRFRNQR